MKQNNAYVFHNHQRSGSELAYLYLEVLDAEHKTLLCRDHLCSSSDFHFVVAVVYVAFKTDAQEDNETPKGHLSLVK